MSAPRIHRCTADSKTGRKLRSANAKVIVGTGLTKEQADWNAEIEAKRQAKGKAAAPGSALAQARQAAHAAFDPYWQRGRMTRSEAYAWLAQHLGIPKDECHMVNFDISMCEHVVAICGAPRERIIDLFDTL